MKTLSNNEKGDLLELSIWNAIENSMRDILRDVDKGPREPYVRATLRGYVTNTETKKDNVIYSYEAKWNSANTSKEGSSRPDFIVFKRIITINDTYSCSGDEGRYSTEYIPILNIEAHNLNTSFKVSYSWHKCNTLSRFRDQRASQNYLVTSCYNPTTTDCDKIMESFYKYNIILMPLGRQILSGKDMLALFQIQEILDPYLEQVFTWTNTQEITLNS
ncbi:MAG TPA: hypothetical protein VJZ75_10350 [Candidatus Bathyarchaeia archaeon]|nr:hypothetical protein [Candidatus Bathyarchaeia archaeon]